MIKEVELNFKRAYFSNQDAFFLDNELVDDCLTVLFRIVVESRILKVAF